MGVPRGDSRGRAEAVPSSRAEKDEFTSGKPKGLKPFPTYYSEAGRVPSVPEGETNNTFTQSQVRALHRAYWEVEPGASLEDMLEVARKDPAFKNRREETNVRQVGRLFTSLPDSFPWGWRSRAMASTAHMLAHELLITPQGTTLTEVIARLQKRHRNFPGLEAFKQGSIRVWADEPKRFPFLAPFRDKTHGFKLEAKGDAPPIRKHINGLGLVLNEALAREVHRLAGQAKPSWTTKEFSAFVADQLGEKFTDRTLKELHAKFPKLVPEYQVVRAGAYERVAKQLADVYSREKPGTVDEMLSALKRNHGVELEKTELNYLRTLHPELVPNFKKIGAVTGAEVREFLDAISAHPQMPYEQVGVGLGHDSQRSKAIIQVIRRHHAEQLTRRAEKFSDADKKALRQAIDDAPVSAQLRELLDVFRSEHPEAFARHPYTNAQSLVTTLANVLNIPSWTDFQKARYADLFAALAAKSPPGTGLTELISFMRDAHPGSFHRSSVIRIIAECRKAPERFPELAKLRDREGRFPWERSQVSLTAELAKRVGAAIAASPNASLVQIVTRLNRDPAFAKEYPNFDKSRVHNLRARHPQLVPYVDDLKVVGVKARRQARKDAYGQLAKRIADAVVDEGRKGGITVAALARKLRVPPHRVLAAVRQNPALFPWYRERPSGEIDLSLATRVAIELEKAPLGTTLRDVLRTLQKSEQFTERYPSFNYHSFQRLRERYPDIVPEWFTRDEVLRSMILVDAVRAAPKGEKYGTIARRLNQEYPGYFTGRWTKPSHVRRVWEARPELFPFAREFLASQGGFQLEGLGQQPEASTNSDKTASQLASELALLETVPDKLPLLERVVGKVNKEYFSDFEFLNIQHLLGAQVALFEACRRLGMKPSRTSIVGIPYSVSETVVDTLQDKGWSVRAPPLDLEIWYQDVKDAMEERIASAEANGRKIVVIDDGGLVAMMFDRYPELARKAHLFRIVEQTTRGITVAEGVDLHSPVINVAQSPTKAVEGPMIGKDVLRKLIGRLKGAGVKSLRGKKIGLTGYGKTGKFVATALKSQGAVVTILDISDKVLAQAKDDGFAVATDRKKFFEQQDVLIGSTGHLSMKDEDFEHLKDGVILGSSSSKLVEIDVEGLARRSGKRGERVVDDSVFPPTVSYYFKDGRQVTLLAKGFPLNFDGSVHAVPAEDIQLTMGLLLLGALQACGAKAAGLHLLDPEAQKDILEDFGKVESKEHREKEMAEAISIAEEELGDLSERRGPGRHHHAPTPTAN